MAKSPDAFRTISEVADWLGIQAHVLRFWESKFTQVKPVKRAGGRRYYRPSDMQLLGGIKQLLHEDGLTIKGVQKILREEGMSYVSAKSPPLDELTQSQIDDEPEIPFTDAPEEAPAEETGVVLSFDKPSETSVTEIKVDTPDQAGEAPDAKPDTDPATQAAPELPAERAAADAPQPPQAPVEPEIAQPDVTPAPDPAASEGVPGDTTEAAASEIEDASTEGTSHTPLTDAPATPPATPEVGADAAQVAEAAPEEPGPEPETTAEPAPEGAPDPAPAAASLPAFLRRPPAEEPVATDNPPPQDAPVEDVAAAPPPTPEAPPPLKPRQIDPPALTPFDEIPAAPGVLTAAYRTRRLSTAQAKQIGPLMQKLAVLRDSMGARRPPGGPSGAND